MKFYNRIVLYYLLALTTVFTSCEDTYEPSNKVETPTVETGGKTNGLYLGLIGFNESLQEKSLGILNTSSSTDYLTFIDNLQTSTGTVLYHAVNKSLDNIAAANFPGDLVNVSIVTFTDGLDLGSYILNANYNSGEEYLEAVNNRIKTDSINGIGISAYAIGTRGDDVTDIAQFDKNLRNLSSRASNAMEISNISEATGTFRDIASSLTSITNKQMLELTIPAPNPGTKIRFTLDPITNADNSSLYIEGIFTAQDNAFSLTDVEYEGITCKNEGVVVGTTSGINITFSFEDIKRIIPEPNAGFEVKQWSYITSNDSWQINSEFNQNDNTETIIESSSAAIVLVLDCSSSLGSDFDEMREAAKTFIDVLLDAIEE